MCHRRRLRSSPICDGDDDLERTLCNLLGFSLRFRFIAFGYSLALGLSLLPRFIYCMRALALGFQPSAAIYVLYARVGVFG